LKYLECNGCGANDYRQLRVYPGFADTDLVACRRCGLMQAQPLPTDDFLWDYYNSNFGNDPSQGFSMTDKNEAGFRTRAMHQLNFIREFVELDGRGRRVIDVGCHAGSLLSLFKERGWEVVGIDPNPRSEYGKKWYGIDVIRKLFAPGLFEASSFDAVLHSHALEHVRDPRGYLAEFHRILKPGGFAFVEVPNESEKRVLTAKRIAPHLYFFTPETLGALARQTGFEVEVTRVLAVDPLRAKLFTREGLAWLALRSKARYDARGRLNLLTSVPYFGKLTKQDRYFKDYEPEASFLRMILRKPGRA
jgi:SAM-dependent methyltransferase